MPERVEGRLQALDANAPDADGRRADVVVLPANNLDAGDELCDLLVAARMVPARSAIRHVMHARPESAQCVAQCRSSYRSFPACMATVKLQCAEGTLRNVAERAQVGLHTIGRIIQYGVLAGWTHRLVDTSTTRPRQDPTSGDVWSGLC